MSKNLTDAQARLNKLEIYLQDKGLKISKPRMIVADVFFRSSSHLTLDELLEKSRKKLKTIGYATVYRAMKLLVESGLAMEHQFGGGQTRFENVMENEHHDHLICVKCGTIIEFHDEKIEEQQDKAAKKYGFKVLDHRLELYGHCKKCK